MKKKTKKFISWLIRVSGLISLISYTIAIMYVWIYANINGYTYFSAGEPLLHVKYVEWLLGVTGIVVALYYVKKELDWF